MGGGHVDGAGLVVQCVLTTSTTNTSSGATGWVANTILDTSFTPKFSNSLIIVEIDLQLRVSTTNGNEVGGAVRIKSGSTVIGGTPNNSIEAYFYASTLAAGSSYFRTRYAKTVQDDSSNTGARTYSFDTLKHGGTDVLNISNVAPSTMKITEIAQ